jgi:L-asparagine oxygenase
MEVLRLPDSNRQVWQRDLNGLEFPLHNDWPAWTAFERASVEIAARHLTPEIADALARLPRPHVPRDRGALVIENLPVDSLLPEPPRDNFRPAAKSVISEAVHLGIVRQFAHVFGFEEEEEGAIIHQIAPKAGRETTQSNGGVVLFKPHSDDAFLHRLHRPEFLSLFGLVNENAAPTWLFPVESVLEHLTPEAIRQLAKDDYLQAPPQSFLTGGAVIATTRHPVLERHEGGWEISFNSSRTSGLFPEAERALDTLRWALQVARHSEVVIQPGTLLIFSNLRHLHGRAAVSGHRWLQRLYSRRDLSNLRADSGVEVPCLIFPAARLVMERGSLVSDSAAQKIIA